MRVPPRNPGEPRTHRILRGPPGSPHSRTHADEGVSREHFRACSPGWQGSFHGMPIGSSCSPCKMSYSLSILTGVSAMTLVSPIGTSLLYWGPSYDPFLAYGDFLTEFTTSFHFFTLVPLSLPGGPVGDLSIFIVECLFSIVRVLLSFFSSSSCFGRVVSCERIVRGD